MTIRFGSSSFANFLFFFRWICKCKSSEEDANCAIDKTSTRKVGKFVAKKSLRLAGLEKSKFLAKSINLKTTERCRSNCEHKLVERVARRSKLISDSSQLIHCQLNSPNKQIIEDDTRYKLICK